MRRPLVLVGLLYVAGILLAEIPVPLLQLFLLAFSLAFIFPFSKPLRNVLLCSLIVLCGWINTARRTAILSPNDLRNLSGNEAQIAALRGRLIETPRARPHEIKDRELWNSSARLAVNSARLSDGVWRPASGMVLCTVAQKLAEAFFAGQTVEVSGVLQPPKGAIAEGLFDYREYLRHQGIYRQLSSRQVSDWKIIPSPAQAPLADRFSAWARKALMLGMPAEDEIIHLEWALTLGWKAGITDETMETFVQASTIHIFAVDGLRIAIVSGLLFFLLRRAGFSRVWCGVLAIPCLWFYAAMTGWPASAIRAMVMILVIYGGWVLKRPSDLINSLFGAALIILVWEPRQLFQAGFQLSFVVVLCLLLALPALERIGKYLTRADPLRPESLQPFWQKTLRGGAVYGIDLFLTSLAAWAGSIPLVAYYFHSISPVSGFSNLLAVPLCVLVLICNLSSLLVAGWLPPAAVLLNHAGWICMKAILITSTWFAHLPNACLNASIPSLFSIGLYYVILISVATGWLWEMPRRKMKIIGLASLMAIWLGFCLRDLTGSCLTLLPVQNGHAVYLSQPGWRGDWLIDCGNESGASRIVKPFLQAHGVNRLQNLVLTHGEAAYTGGARLIATLFAPRNLYTSALNFRSPAYREFMAGMSGQCEPHTALETDAAIPPWTVLYPSSKSRLAKAAENSLVLRGDFNGLRVLLISNLGHEGQNALLDSRHDLRAEFVFSGSSTQDEPLIEPLLEAIRPKIIVVADSQKAMAESAREALRRRLQKREAQIFYTSESDAVTLEIRPGIWALRTMNGAHLCGSIRTVAPDPPTP